MALSNPTPIISADNLDFHSRMDEQDTNMHYPRGFREAQNGSQVIRSAGAVVEYPLQNPLSAALDFANSSTTPPTEVDGDIYILGTELSALTVTDIVWQSGFTVRISFSGAPDLSSTTTDDYFTITTATNSNNNGRFIITDVNDGSDYVEIENTNRTDASEDETSISVASFIAYSDWDGAINNEWVKYNSTEDEWQRIIPVEGIIVYLKDEDIQYSFNGNAWSQIVASGGIPTYTSTDHAVPRADGTGGDLQDSGIIVDDADNISGVNTFEFSGFDASNPLMSVSGSNVEFYSTDANTFYFDNSGAGNFTKSWFYADGSSSTYGFGQNGGANGCALQIDNDTIRIWQKNEVAFWIKDTAQLTNGVDMPNTALSARGGKINGHLYSNSVLLGGTGVDILADNTAYAQNLEVQGGTLDLVQATENTSFIDAGSVAATEQDWIEVTVGGNTGYIRVYATK